MRLLFVLLSLVVFVTSCKKKQQSEPLPTLTKWDLILGHYKVYDTTGVFIYEMDITHSIGTTIQGYRADSLTFTNFDGNFDLTAFQSQGSPYPNNVTIGSYTALHDSIDNRWDIFDFGSDEEFNNFRNDTIVFYFQKQNMPYWLNDATPYFNGNLKHIAVKQH